MRKIKPKRFIRLKLNSLFLQLITGFLCIIVLLASLTYYAVSASITHIRQEIGKYNTLMLHNTMENYEDHLEMIKKQMVLFYFSESVQRLQREPDYSNYAEVIKDIQSWVTNPYLYIDNIVFYSKSPSFILEKGTSTQPDTLFNVFMKSEAYPLEFWNKQFDESYTNRVFPAATFSNVSFRDRKGSRGESIPIIFKIQNDRNFYMAVFLDADKMYKAFDQTLNEDFMMYNAAGETMFERSAADPFLPLEQLKRHGDSGFVRDHKYHFYTTGAGSEMTYIHRLPVEQMTSQSRLNVTMVAVIVIVILVSVLISIFLAARINNPLKQLIHSMGNAQAGKPFRSKIHEFEMISGQFNNKDNMLKQWAFFNYLKDIRSRESDLAKLEFPDQPFVFLLFHVREKKQASPMHGSFQGWLYYIKAFIEVKLNRTFEEALTIQIEHDQILSLVFTEDTQALKEMLAGMKSVFDHDSDSGIITIAMTSRFDHFKQVPEAYKQVHERIGNRRLIDETEIVDDSSADPVVCAFTKEQEKAFQANMKEGNFEELALLLGRFFAKWETQTVSEAAWVRFAEGAAERIRQAAPAEGGAGGTPERCSEQIRECTTVNELQALLLHWIKEGSERIREKKERKDGITSFVMEYVNAHLADEIYLDTLADKLNISSGYLSTYFKDKTGTNLVEYINEVRIREATVLLVESPLKIQQIAEAVGYRNITSFNRMFKKHTGLTPNDYRKSRMSPPGNAG
ncbi:helix-turn-helix domain-containing protein [Saccharibacillus deserti]|uniref:helix-turn-helix domain-containing protein n=1 Tax=Saccharibacillus deserti TaxID=1634444 RepID=UPI0015548057|nr:AraC family transcriptional regulator [Saccharibacillus deserti]